MGEAKRRGTLQERKELAAARPKPAKPHKAKTSTMLAVATLMATAMASFRK